MATAYYTDAASAGVPAYYQSGGGFQVPFSYTLTASGWSTVVNDTLRMFNIPANVKLMEVYLSHPDLETAGPTLTVQIGDSSAADTFVTTDSTSCRAAYNDWLTQYTTYVAAILPKNYTSANYMVMKANAVTAGVGTGAIKGFAMMRAL